MIFNYFTYRDEAVTCKHCGWQGQGSDMPPEFVSEVHFIWELSCPQCFETLGCCQGPPREEVEAWMLAHPGWKPH